MAIIGGSGLERLLEGSKLVQLDTPYGPAPPISIGLMDSNEVAFLSRHGPKHDLPPHKVNYRANLHALKQLGAERVIATNAVGSINPAYDAGDLAIPADLLDMTKSRTGTFFDSSPVTHIDVSEPYCPEIRSVLTECGKTSGVETRTNSIMVATEGPRYETPAEIRMYHKLGGDIVGMTGAPEVFLARELEMCYATLCFISNKAAGMQERLTHAEVLEVGQRVMPAMFKIIRQTIEKLPKDRNCSCSKTIHQAQA
jgi:5'-methylthioadenosine phosphorylase